MIGSLIALEAVLYEYDGPVIFTSNIGLSKFIFFKADENAEYDVYLASETNEDVISLLRTGKLSVLGALRTDSVYVFRLRDLKVVSYAPVSISDIPSGALPQPTVALFPHFGSTVDYIEQAASFFSIRFEGDRLSRSQIPFAVFKRLIDNAYEATRRLFSPSLLMGSRSTLFDYPLFRPAFSSLIVSIGEPTFDLEKVSEKAGYKVQSVELRAQFDEQRDVFFNEMSSVVRLAERAKLSAGAIEENFILIENIRGLIPTSHNGLSTVEFVSQHNSSTRKIQVTEKIGDTIEKAIREAGDIEVTERGTIGIINANKNSFVLNSDRGREVTCYLDADDFANLDRKTAFRQKARIFLRGRLTRRSNRDLMTHVSSTTLI